MAGSAHLRHDRPRLSRPHDIRQHPDSRPGHRGKERHRDRARETQLYAAGLPAREPRRGRSPDFLPATTGLARILTGPVPGSRRRACQVASQVTCRLPPKITHCDLRGAVRCRAASRCRGNARFPTLPAWIASAGRGVRCPVPYRTPSRFPPAGAAVNDRLSGTSPITDRTQPGQSRSPQPHGPEGLPSASRANQNRSWPPCSAAPPPAGGPARSAARGVSPPPTSPRPA
jgi:hypothetical protein